MKITRQIKVSGPLFETKTLDPTIKLAVKNTLEFGKGIIKAATPIDTGLLEAGWYYRTEEMAIFNEVPYSVYVEEGTSRMEGRFMAQNSVPAISEFLDQEVSKQLNQKLN